MRIDPSRFSCLLSFAYRSWCRSLSFQGEGLEHVDAAANQGRRLIYTLWHDELFPLSWYAMSLKLRVATMVSQSRDGELLAQIIESLGIPTIRGSSSRGGMKALVAAIRLIKRQEMDIVITVDGPRGPRHVAKDGALHLAAKTGACIIPVRACMSRAYVFHKAWDKFQLPWPFTCCRVLFGEPYAIPNSSDKMELEQERKKLELRLETLGSKFQVNASGK